MNKVGLHILALSLAPVISAHPAMAAAQPATAEQALETYRKTFQSPRQLDCPKSEGSDEIIVCARSKGAPDPNRLPLPVMREPGDRIPGEALVDGGGCMRLCHEPVRIDLLKVPAFVAGVIERLKDD